MCFPIKWQEVMLTCRIECNIFLYYHLMTVNGKCLRKMFSCILIHTSIYLFIHSGDPRGRFDKTLSVRILADRRKYLAYSRLDSLFIHHFTPVTRE